MVAKLLAIFLIIPTIYAKINVDISATNDNKREVHISGSVTNLITEEERKTFGLTDEKVKQTIAKYFGTIPDNVYLQSPTPWGNLFKTMNWQQIRRVVLPQKAAILSAKSEPVLVKTKEFLNEGSTEKSFNTEMIEYVTNAVSSKWDSDGKLDVEDVLYEFDMKTEPTFLTFLSKWGEDTDKYMPMTIGSQVQMTLAPKQKVLTELYVTKEEMVIRVDYETSLEGSVAMNFDKLYKGHKFWSVNINNILASGGLKTVVHTSEMIDFVQFTDPRVVVKDAMSGEVIKTVLLKVL